MEYDNKKPAINSEEAVPAKILNDPQDLGRRPRMAVFGGSFNPIHIGHLLLAGDIIRRRLADEVLFVPANIPPHKLDQELASAEDRLRMLELAVEPYPEFSISDIELVKTSGPAYTYETMQVLSKVFPGHEIFFLMGMDSLCDLHEWYRAPELVNRFELRVYPRPGINLPSSAVLVKHFGPRQAKRLLDSVIDMPSVPISASVIRTIIAAQQTAAGLLTPAVQQYIDQHQLYKNTPMKDEEC